MITIMQIRAARALLDITQRDLAGRVGISFTGLSNIERGKSDPRYSTMSRIWEELEEAGVEFTGETGVRLPRAEPGK